LGADTATWFVSIVKEAVIVYLFPGGTARRHSSCSAASFEAGIDAAMIDTGRRWLMRRPGYENVPL